MKAMNKIIYLVKDIYGKDKTYTSIDMLEKEEGKGYYKGENRLTPRLIRGILKLYSGCYETPWVRVGATGDTGQGCKEIYACYQTEIKEFANKMRKENKDYFIHRGYSEDGTYYGF